MTRIPPESAGSSPLWGLSGLQAREGRKSEIGVRHTYLVTLTDAMKASLILKLGSCFHAIMAGEIELRWAARICRSFLQMDWVMYINQKCYYCLRFADKIICMSFLHYRVNCSMRMRVYPQAH